MENLRFGTTARRKALRRQRRRRIALASWALLTIGVVAGVPLARTSALGLLEGITGADQVRAARGGVVVEPGKGYAAEAAATAVPLRESPSPTTTEKKDKGPITHDAYAGKSVSEIIVMAGAEFGVDGDYLLSIAECESGLDPRAYNSAGYHGLFQYDDSTWSAYGYGSIWDPVAQARTTAMLIADGQSSRWPNCA